MDEIDGRGWGVGAGTGPCGRLARDRRPASGRRPGREDRGRHYRVAVVFRHEGLEAVNVNLLAALVWRLASRHAPSLRLYEDVLARTRDHLSPS